MDTKNLGFSEEVAIIRNPLLTAKLGLTTIQMQVFEEMIAKINPKDENFHIIQLNIKQFADRIGANPVKLYNEVERITKQMIRPVKIQENDGSDYSWVALLTKAKHWKRKGVIELQFHQDLKPYLLEISGSQYFKIHREATRHLSNPHFNRLYWVLSSWRRKKQIITVDLTLDYIKTAVELEGQYPVYQDLKKRFLNPARADFMKYGEFYFDFEEIRRNPQSKRSEIIKVRFIIFDNPNWKPQREEPIPYELVEPDITTPEMQEVVNALTGLSKSITKAQATQFAINHANTKPEDILSEILNFLKQKGKGKDIIDPLAWLSVAIKNNYNKGLFEETQEKKKEQAEQHKINTWYAEYETRYKEYKFKKAEEATPEEIEYFKENHKHLLNQKGEPLKEFLGEFVGIYRNETPSDKDTNFINWTRKHKGESLQRLDGKFKVVQTLF